MHWSPPGSSVHGILQARILEWVTISFSRGSSRPRNQTEVSCIASGQTLEPLTTKKSPSECFVKQEPESRLCDVILGSLQCMLYTKARMIFQKHWCAHTVVLFNIHQWLAYSRWIINKDLLYSTGTSVQCYVAAGWGRSLEENGYTYMYDWVPLLSAWSYHNIVNRLYSNIK